ncbi:hypothetical protein [Alistipes putredinis]|uniref:hypothetical protein n=1 Tax=Alistipes putredinis TaxID=28117 RepID=UPI00399687A7
MIRIRTGLDTSDQFLQISDERAACTPQAQQQTFRYFWRGAGTDEAAWRASATSSGATVTTGGTGFGGDGHGGGRQSAVS